MVDESIDQSVHLGVFVVARLIAFWEELVLLPSAKGLADVMLGNSRASIFILLVTFEISIAFDHITPFRKQHSARLSNGVLKVSSTSRIL
jgi:hypothetical protein